MRLGNAQPYLEKYEMHGGGVRIEVGTLGNLF